MWQLLSFKYILLCWSADCGVIIIIYTAPSTSVKNAVISFLTSVQLWEFITLDRPTWRSKRPE